MTTEVLIGDRVRWESAEGTKRGEVMQIFDALDSYGDNINFYHIACSDGFNGTSMAMISEDRLHEIEFKVTFRDVEIQMARGEK
jgi:chemotaxis methyl-accepting protein methylase